MVLLAIPIVLMIVAAFVALAIIFVIMCIGLIGAVYAGLKSLANSIIEWSTKR